jgi:hypothetical protein
MNVIKIIEIVFLVVGFFVFTASMVGLLILSIFKSIQNGTDPNDI